MIDCYLHPVRMQIAIIGLSHEWKSCLEWSRSLGDSLVFLFLALKEWITAYKLVSLSDWMGILLRKTRSISLSSIIEKNKLSYENPWGVRFWMRFSVIIPARNAEKSIGRAIESVLNQDFDDCEITAAAVAAVNWQRKFWWNWAMPISKDLVASSIGLTKQNKTDPGVHSWVFSVYARLSPNLCKPPMWCIIGAPHWR